MTEIWNGAISIDSPMSKTVSCVKLRKWSAFAKFRYFGLGTLVSRFFAKLRFQIKKM